MDCPRSVARSASDIVVHALWFHAWLKISITAFAGAVFGPTMAPAMYALVIALTAGSLQPLSVGYSTQVVGHVCPFGSGPVVVWGGEAARPELRGRIPLVSEREGSGCAEWASAAGVHNYGVGRGRGREWFLVLGATQRDNATTSAHA